MGFESRCLSYIRVAHTMFIRQVRNLSGNVMEQNAFAFTTLLTIAGLFEIIPFPDM